MKKSITKAFVYSDEEISATGNKITILSGDGLGDTEVIVLVVTAFVSLDLLINLLGSMIPTMNDGIGTHSIIWGNLYFGDNLWNHERFFNAFVKSALVTFAVFVENVVLAIVDIVKK